MPLTPLKITKYLSRSQFNLLGGVISFVVLSQNGFAQSCNITAGVGSFPANCNDAIVTENVSQNNGFSFTGAPATSTFTNAFSYRTNNTPLTVRGSNVTASTIVNTITNNGTIASTSEDSAIAVSQGGLIGTLNNYGSITSGTNFRGSLVGWTIQLFGSPGGVINSLNNYGTIGHDLQGRSSSSAGIGISISSLSDNSIQSLTNYGTISAYNGGPGIFNGRFGGIGTLSNLQGAGNAAGPLTITGFLPNNYNVIINSPTVYGQLSALTINCLDGNNPTNFGIFPSSTLPAPGSGTTTYANVLQNITAVNNTSGIQIINGTSYNWALLENATVANNRDLAIIAPAKAPFVVVPGTDNTPTPTSANPVTTGTATVQLLSGATVIATTEARLVTDPKTGTTYVVETIDAPLDGQTVALLRAAGLNIAPDGIDTFNSVNALSQSIQNVVGFQQAALNNSLMYDCTIFDENNICLSAGGRYTFVNGDAGTNTTAALLVAAYRPDPNWRVGAFLDKSLAVNSSNASYSGSSAPMWGLFAAWAQEPETKRKWEIKGGISSATNDLTFTRTAIYNEGFSEPGSGSTTVSAMSAQLMARYGFEVDKQSVLGPYVGVRYHSGKMNSYSEVESASVNTPLTYAAVNYRSTTGLLGVFGDSRLSEKWRLFGTAGFESDFNKRIDDLITTEGSDILVPMGTNQRTTRGSASIGVSYDTGKNERVSLMGVYRQELYQGVSTSTVLATYTVGL
jgi:phosphohistidine swiveling domain-containing protein